MFATLSLKLLPEGKYVAYGDYSLADDPLSSRPLESFFDLSYTELLLVFEGSFAPFGRSKHGFKLELEIPKNDIGKGYFVFEAADLREIKGVVGSVGTDTLIFAGRSTTPPTQVSAHMVFVDQHNVSFKGLLAYEDTKWITWSTSIKSYDPQKAKAAVMALPRRA